jgi:hypothetical protein
VATLMTVGDTAAISVMVVKTTTTPARAKVLATTHGGINVAYTL